MTPRLSVILCTYNRARMMSHALESLCGQTLDPSLYEVVVVDNNSRDDTRAIVDGVAGRRPNVRYVLETKQGLSNARNCGAETALGEYLAYMDDDAIAPPEYLEAVLANLDAHRPDILGGPIYPFYRVPKPRWFRDEWEIRRWVPRSGFATSGGISGSNYVIRRDLLRQLGMFDPRLGMIGGQLGLGEDRKVLETYRRTVPVEQQRVYYALECRMLHLVPKSKMRLSYMIARHFAAGRMGVTVKGRAATLAEALRTLVQMPGIVYRKHLNVRRDGWDAIDMVAAARRAIFESGLAYEGIRQAALRGKRRLGWRARAVRHVRGT